MSLPDDEDGSAWRRALRSERERSRASSEDLERFYRSLDEVGRDPDFKPEDHGPRDSRPRSRPVWTSPWFLLVASAATLGVSILVLVNHAREERQGANLALSPSARARASLAPLSPKTQLAGVPVPWRIDDAKGEPNHRIITGTVGAEPFLRVVANAGLDQSETYRVFGPLRELVDLDHCKKTDRFVALVDRTTRRVKAFEYLVGPEEIYQLREGADGSLKAGRLDFKVERHERIGVLAFDGVSVDQSARHAGFEPGLERVFDKAFDGRPELERLERGDVIRFVVGEVTVLGAFARYSEVEALEVSFSAEKNPRLRLYYWDQGGLSGWYDANGTSPSEGDWRMPVQGARLTSPFNPHRLHPILKRIVPHLGTDLAIAMGTPVGAAAPGTISFVGSGGPTGNLVKVLHPGGIETGYAHLSRFARGLKVGDKVASLQTIGYVGSTGRSTGPHLHFSASRDGKFFDAMTLRFDGTRKLEAESRASLALVIAKYDPMLDRIPAPPALPSFGMGDGAESESKPRRRQDKRSPTAR